MGHLSVHLSNSGGEGSGAGFMIVLLVLGEFAWCHPVWAHPLEISCRNTSRNISIVTEDAYSDGAGFSFCKDVGEGSAALRKVERLHDTRFAMVVFGEICLVFEEEEGGLSVLS